MTRVVRSVVEIIGDTIKPGMNDPARSMIAGQQVVAALQAAGYSIVRGASRSGTLVERGPGPKPVLTNAIAGENGRRGVFNR